MSSAQIEQRSCSVLQLLLLVQNPYPVNKKKTGQSSTSLTQKPTNLSRSCLLSLNLTITSTSQLFRTREEIGKKARKQLISLIKMTSSFPIITQGLTTVKQKKEIRSMKIGAREKCGHYLNLIFLLSMKI